MTDPKRFPESESRAKELKADETIADDTWVSLIAEARGLLTIAPEAMSPEQLNRLDTISDALIHLVGYAQSLRRPDVVERRVVDELSQRTVHHRQLAAARARHPAPSSDMSDAEQRALRDRILTGLHASQLRVREGTAPPTRRALEPTAVPSAELLRSLEPLRRAVLVPELAIAAGAGAELWAVECTTTVDVPPDLPRARYLALEVIGASMEPLIHSGDLVLVRVDDTAVPGTVVVARDPDHGYVVKEVGRLTAHGIELRSLNPAFPPLLVPHGAGVVLGTVVLRWARRGS